MTQIELPTSGGSSRPSRHTQAEPPETKPVNFGVVVFPGFQALDVFGPLDALNLLSRTYKMNLYVLAETLAPVSTQRPASTDDGPGSDFAQRIVPTHTFAAPPPARLDVLLVPGGPGTRLPGIAAAVACVAAAFPALRYLITVCTGAGVAARAGVLDGRRATTNKRAWAETVALRPQVRWVRRARWVEDDGGKVWTSSGISAGIDVVFAWMRAVYGEETAREIADRMEYTPVLDPDDDPFADRWG